MSILSKILTKEHKLVQKKFGTKKQKEKEKKFIILEIDGLSYPDLKKAIEMGKCRYIKKLIKKKRYHLQEFNPGIPANTPSSTAGIFYGENNDIPGFRFMDKKKNKHYSFGSPETAVFIEKKFKNGILSNGGSSYMTMFTAGASRTVLTMSTFLDKNNLPKLRNSDLMFHFFINPFSLLRVIFYSVKEIILEIFEWILDTITKIFKGKFANLPFQYPYFPLTRMFMNATFREITVRGILLDIGLNVPYIYASFAGYDELAHYRGPKSWSAYSALVEIDRKIKKICKRAKGYDIFIISDHGNTPAESFDEKYFESLDDFISRCCNANIKEERFVSVDDSRIAYLYYRLRNAARYLSAPLKWFFNLITWPIRKRETKSEVKNTIYVKNSSNLAHVYFMESKRRLELKDIENKYPMLLTRLVNHPGIGLVVVKDGSKIIVYHETGIATIKNGKVKYNGENFLSKYGDEKVISQIEYLANMDLVGDIILFGEYDGKECVAFERFHFGAHTALGGEQNKAFFISKDKYNLGKVENSTELHKIFKAYH